MLNEATTQYSKCISISGGITVLISSENGLDQSYAYVSVCFYFTQILMFRLMSNSMLAYVVRENQALQLCLFIFFNPPKCNYVW